MFLNEILQHNFLSNKAEDLKRNSSTVNPNSVLKIKIKTF